MERVTLNVGGQLFTTTLATLRSFGTETLLGTLSLKEGIENQDDPVFLDRDPILFQHILNCMRHRRVFEARQLDLSPSIWDLELAYYGLPTKKEQEKKVESKKRMRPIDVVNELKEEARKLANNQREKIEAVLMWMLSFYPKEKEFRFANFDRTLVFKPDDMPQEVFDMDQAYILKFQKEFETICNDNKMFVNFNYGMSNNPAGLRPSSSFNLNGMIHVVRITIRCFGD
jgi:hypothetical protein